MKIVTVVVVFVMMVFIGGRSWGQNLVGNGSFENYIDCPSNADQVYNCVGWESVMIDFVQGYPTSPDYFNTCATSSLVSVPDNAAGYQNPKSGNAYCGLITHAYGVINLREIIQAQLISPMSVGSEYQVSMFVVSGFSDVVDIATNNIGIRFSTVQFDYANPPSINNWANFYSDSVIYDTLNWVPIQGSFIADSAYQYILIGNFFDDQSTTHVQVGVYQFYAYYYVDDVCIVLSGDSCSAEATAISNVKSSTILQISPNPVQNLLTINLLSPSLPATIVVYDVQGRKIVLPIAYSNNKAALTTTTLPNGIYFLQIINNKTGMSEVGKFVKE